MTDHSIIMAALLQKSGLPFATEFQFHHSRKWRFDFAIPSRMIAIEIEGGQWVKGRHQRGKGFALDCEKYNAATMMGWRVLRFTTDHFKNGYALRCLEEAIGVQLVALPAGMGKVLAMK